MYNICSLLYCVCMKGREGDGQFLNKKLWCLELMKAALKDVESGLREAAQTYNVRVEMLRRRDGGQDALDCKSGPGTVLTFPKPMQVYIVMRLE